ncbi:aspartic peptidase domain-containing protein [Mycena galericulata]|nr:aspartic peptidase domain-containing protein [Mycena galericulata]
MPYMYKTPRDLDSEDHRKMSATSENKHFVCELQEHARNHDHDLYYKWDVAKWRILAPSSTPCLGIFWNPDMQCLEGFFSKPLPTVSSGPCRPTTCSFQDLHFSPNDRYAPVFASVGPSNQGYARSLEYGIERRQLDLSDACHGLLHTVDIGTSREDPEYTENLHFSRLAIDTGSINTWVFGEALRIIPKHVGEPERPLVRRGRHSWYIRGAIRNGVEVETITYGDGSRVDVDIHTGPFYLRAELRSSGSSFRVCRSPNLVFGVGTRATLEFETRRIDGIFGLGLQTNFVNSLYHEDRIDEDRFTIALGRKDRRSYLIVGENTAGGAVRLRGEWSSWIQVLPSARQWEIRLESITIRETTIEVGRTVMLDSGTSYCYLPSPACDALGKALDGRPASNSSTHIYPRTQPSETIKFQFNGLSVERGFSDMLDPRPNTTPDPNHGPCAKPIFKPAGALADLGTNREVCILGNFFLRGLVVEFDRTNHAPAGRIRMAARGNDG